MKKKISKETKKSLAMILSILLFIGVVGALSYGIMSLEDWKYHIDNLLAEELVVGEEIILVDPPRSRPFEGMITVESYFTVTTDPKNIEGQGLKVKDLSDALEENNSVVQTRKNATYIFREDGKKFSTYNTSESYTLQVYYEEKITGEGQTLYKLLGDYYVVVPSQQQ